jgi:predicted nucleotidyltransferase
LPPLSFSQLAGWSSPGSKLPDPKRQQAARTPKPDAPGLLQSLSPNAKLISRTNMNDQAQNIAREFAALLRDRLGPRVKQVILFGSQARGDARDGSDYDVLVVVDERTPEIEETVLDTDVEMMNRHETLFASIIKTEKEWRRLEKFPIGWNIKQEGIGL